MNRTSLQTDNESWEAVVIGSVLESLHILASISSSLINFSTELFLRSKIVHKNLFQFYVCVNSWSIIQIYIVQVHKLEKNG